MTPCLAMEHEARWMPIPEIAFCEEKNRLLGDFLRAIHELNDLLKQQMECVAGEDPNFTRFDGLLHVAQEKKDNAKYAWMAHVEAHHCEQG